MDLMNLGQKSQVEIVRASHPLENSLDFNNIFEVELLQNGIVVTKFRIRNGITNVGKNALLDVKFNDGAQVANSSWYIGLVDSSGFTAFAAGDTMSSHGGWNEFTTYSEATRVAWGSNVASGQSTSNSSPATFNINGSGTVKGTFLVSNNTKSGTTGELWATAQFAADVPVNNGDQLKITYTVSA